MIPAPTTDAANPVATVRPSAGRTMDKAKSDAGAKVGAAKGDDDFDLVAKLLIDDTDILIDGRDHKQSTPTFEAIVNDADDVNAPPEMPGVVMELASPQMSALSAELAALFQGLPVANASDTSAMQNVIPAEQVDAENASKETTLIAVGDDMSRLAEQLSARAASMNRTAVPVYDKPAPPSPATAADGTAVVSLSALQAKTGFDAPVKVTANQQKWFQAVAPVLTGLATPLMRAEPKLTMAAGASVAQPETDTPSFGNTPLLADNPLDAAKPVADQGLAQHSNEDPSARDSAKRGVTTDPAIASSKSTTGVRSSSFQDVSSGLTPPYQQIRSAVAEAIVGAGAAQPTDYVSLYADRPTSPTLTLKTLEISLEPPDLGRVNVKMNLASRDLKLEIEASKASTAQMLSNDKASLKRELLSDNSDLSSVLVSITSSVSDAGSARSTGNGDQPFSGNSRAANENAFASTTSGGREERRHQQASGFQEGGTARQQREGSSNDASAPASGNALYI